MMLLYKETSWRYWAAIELLLILGLAGWPQAFAGAIALALLQVAHFWLREGSFLAFPVQVRLAYAAILIVAEMPGMRWLYWAPAIGTLVLLLFGYCLLAGCLSLLPGNRREDFSWTLVRRTFLASPVRGSVLQGLPAATSR